MVARGHLANANRSRPAAGTGRRTGQKELREFRFQSKSSIGSFSRWTRILLVIAVLQATVGICFWFFTPADSPQISETLNVTAFADPSLQISDLSVRPNDLAILVIASGRRPEALRKCLQSLSRCDGYDPQSVLVAQAGPGAASQQLAQREYGLDWAGPADNSAEHAFDTAPRTAASPISSSVHFKQALEYASQRKFVHRRYRSLLVLEEDLVFAPDMLWFFAQLDKLLRNDVSLWCISAWNDNGRAPYVADPTVVMRTDWFSGIGWVVSLDVLRNELLPEWPGNGRWQQWLRARSARQGKQCLYPEISRVAFSGLGCTAELSLPGGPQYADSSGCTAEEAFVRQLSMFTVMSSAVGVNLGNVDRLQADKYRELFLSTWPGKQGLLHAFPLTTIADLEVRLDHDAAPDAYEDMSQQHQPLLMVVGYKETEESGQVLDTWESVAEYFGLAPGGLRCAYEGVARLWWRDTTLYLALDSSPLLANLKSYHLRRPRVRGADFDKRAQNHLEPQPLPVPPFSLVAGAPTGLSCARYCESLQHTCIDADIASVASCRAPLTSTFQCQHCIRKTTSMSSNAFPGLNRDTEQCAASSPMPGVPELPLGDCAAKSARVRRLCVCRKQIGSTPIRLQSPAFYFVHASVGQNAAMDTSRVSLNSDNSPVRGVRQSGAFPLTRARDVELDENEVSEVPVNVFALQSSRAGNETKPRTELEPSKLSILIVAMAERRSNVDDLDELRETLRSLHSVDQFNRHQIVVAHSEASLATAQLVEEEFGFARIQVQVNFGHSDETPFSRISWLYRIGIEKALSSHFQLSRSILILEEGLRFAPDLLWYFAQLEPLLHRDPTLWCISALNDNGLAPYVADPTVVTRTDWFSGVAWLAPLGLLRGEMFKRWPHEQWESIFRQPALRHSRQCLIPEVTRVRRSATMYPYASRSQKVSINDSPVHRMLLNQKRVVDLGDVERLTEVRYRQLFYADWPGEGLVHAKLLASTRPLLDGRVGKGGSWRLVFRSSDSETDTSWKVIARFLGLWPDVPIRGAYMGVLRLRWHQSVLYLVASSSPFTHSSVGISPPAGYHNPEQFMRGVGPAAASQIVDATAFVNAERPLLLPANGVALLAASSGLSCSSVCSSRGLRCSAEDILSLNHCGPLARLAKCKFCKASEGPEQPAQIADAGDARNGMCLYNVNLLDHPPTCDAHHRGTRRACICRKTIGGQAKAQSEVTTKMQAKLPESAMPLQNRSNTSSGRNASQIIKKIKPRAVKSTPLPSFASKLEMKPSDLAILVMTSGRRSEYLRDTLRSLQQVDGFNPKSVLVSQDTRSLDSKEIVQNEFGLAWIQFKSARRGESQDFGQRVASHYRFAIHHALTSHFADHRSLIVMADDLKLSPDFLWYFAQLEPLLHRDPSLWCICAHNENGLAPYTADPTALSRTDIFPGLAWLVSSDLFLTKLLPSWPETRWDAHFASHAGRAGRQCVVPEMSRIQHISRISEDPNERPRKAALRDLRMFFHPSENMRAVDLGDVSRMTRNIYHEAFISELREARLLESIRELPWPPSHDVADKDKFVGNSSGKVASKVKGWRLHYRSEDPERDQEWHFVADFFLLREALPPRGSYGGVIRLRWGVGVLFLVASSASLLFEARLKQLPEEPVAPRAFKDGKLPTLIPPKGLVLEAAQDGTGMSCSTVCSWHGRECISADLLFLNSCDVMRQFVMCERCELSIGSDQPALGAKRGGALHGACLVNQEPLMHPPRCEASHADTRRLCVCRLPFKDTTRNASALLPGPSAEALTLPMPGPPSVPRLGEAPPSKSAELLSPPGIAPDLGVDLRDAGWKADHQVAAWAAGGISYFADPDEPVGKLEVRPSQLAVLIVASEARMEALRACLTALQQADRFQPLQAIVSLASGEFVEELQSMVKVDFGIPTFMHQTSGLTELAHKASLYSSALEHGFTRHFNTTRSLLVLDDTALLSADALWYFAQLEPLLHEDPSLWCISAWNDNGIAPYVADVTALMRTDWHPGKAWMLTRNIFLRELLPNWPKEQVYEFLNLNSVRRDRQCVIPEISRVRIFRPFGSWKEQALFDEHVLPVFHSEDRHRVFLGDVQRVHQRNYEQLLRYTWPHGEGLANSSEVLHLKKLSQITNGTWRLVVRNMMTASWSAVARYLRLWPQMQPNIRGSYFNCVRLRWQGAVLYILLDDSPLLSNLDRNRVFGSQEFPSRPPVLRALDSTVVLGRPGQSCSAVCSRSIATDKDSRRCHDADLIFLNSCAAMRAHGLEGACAECLSSVGRNQPSVVTTVQPDGPAAGIGTCAVSANLAQPPSCEAAHPWVARLCACRAVVMGAIARDPDAAASRTIILARVPQMGSSSLPTSLKELAPAALIDRALPLSRCGAAFGNGLAPDCAERDLWCCSQDYFCGRSAQHCRSHNSECRRGASPSNFCGGGWTLRLHGLGLESVA